MSLAASFGVSYLYIECQTADLDEIDRRLRSRKRQRSQLAGVRVAPTEGSGKSTVNDAVFLAWMSSMKRPDGDYLLLDTSNTIAHYTSDAVAYVMSRIA